MTEKRPTKFDAAIQEKLADEFAPLINEWAKGGWPTAREALLRVLAWSLSYDGYRIARKLEEHYRIDPDEWLVSTLSEIDWRADQLVLAAQIEWLPSSGLTAPGIGSRTKTPYGDGVVTDNWPHGRSTVRVETISTSPSPPLPTILVVDWEDMTPL